MTNGAGTYARVNGIDLYHEIHGSGPPLILLHGGVLTIELNFAAVLPTLARRHRVVAVELQGHGHTADTERAMSLGQFADDLAALMRHLETPRAHVLGFSLGGLVALEFASRYPEAVDRLVLASTHYRPDGFHEDIRNPALFPDSDRMPAAADFEAMRAAYERVAPDPGHFDAGMAKINDVVGTFQGWPPETLRGISAPTLLMIGDHDFVRLDHAVEMLDLIPGARLAVLPGTTHMALMRRAQWVLPMVTDFLSTT